jgi:hypothetical protein
LVRRAAAIGLLAGLAMIGGAAGCRSDGDKLCDARCDCEGCSMVESDDCFDDADDIARLAEHDGCGDAFAAYVSCALDQGTCSDGAWVAPACADEATALKTCSRWSSSFVRSACDEESLKRTACGNSQGSPDPNRPCTGVDACVAACALTPEATCEVLQDPVAEDAYTKCVLKCTNP